MFLSRETLRPSDILIRGAIVALALSTAYIHSTLGGLLFTLNAIDYVTAAVAIAIPLGLAVRFRWVVRLGLIGYALTTLIVVVAVDFARMDGSPIIVIKREFASFAALVTNRGGTAGAGA